MKKNWMILCGIMATQCLFGQTVLPIDPKVESPKFGDNRATTSQQPVAPKQIKPIYGFIQNNMVIPKFDAEPFVDEGVVVVSFTVEPDGTLSNYNVDNSINNRLDQCVIECLKLTSGKWLPGRADGTPKPMESKVYVKFDFPGNSSHIDYAKMYCRRPSNSTIKVSPTSSWAKRPIHPADATKGHWRS